MRPVSYTHLDVYKRQALGGQLTMTIEVDGHVYHEDLVISEKTLAKGGDEMLEKKHQVPQVPAPGGGKQDRSRDKDGERCV